MPGERLRVRTEEGDSRRWGSPASGLAGRYNHDPSYPQYLCILQFMGEEDVAGGGTPKPLTLFTIGVMYLELYLLDQWEGQ